MLSDTEKRILKEILKDTEKSLQKRLDFWKNFQVQDGSAGAFYRYEFEPFEKLKEKLEKDYELF
jgi:hypothetical protein